METCGPDSVRAGEGEGAFERLAGAMASERTAGLETKSSPPGDLTCGAAALWLWRVPTLMIVAGAFWPAGRFWLWIPAFLVAGGACLVNARRCGRVHCYATGPLYLGAVGYLVLVLLDVVPFRFGWFLGTVVGLSLLAHAAERQLGRYRGPGPRSAASRTGE